VAEGLALRSHGNPENVKQGANSCPDGTLGRTKTVEAAGKDERGKRPHEPLLIQSDEKGFFFAERGVRDYGDAQAPHGGAFPEEGCRTIARNASLPNRQPVSWGQSADGRLALVVSVARCDAAHGNQDGLLEHTATQRR
jgi:hypothetical protein